MSFMDPGVPLYLWMLLFLVFLFFAFVGLVLYASQNRMPHLVLPSHNKKSQLLKEQYAKGEISEEEFHNRMKSIEKQGKF